MPGVFQELWTGEVIRKARASGSFLDAVPDRSSLVNNSVIHLVDLGADPQVLIDNTTYPVATNAWADADLPIGLRKLSTTNTRVRRDQLFAVSFDVIGECIEQHVSRIREASFELAAHAFSPAADTADTPIVVTTGASDGGANPRKMMTPADVARLKRRFDERKWPIEGRVLCLHPMHVEQLLTSSQAFAQQYSDIREGRVLKLWGFEIREFPTTAVYDAANAKKAFGAAAAPTTDRYSSFAFIASRMFKAYADVEMFWREASTSPDQRAHEIGFDLRFIALPKKAEGYGAIVSVP